MPVKDFYLKIKIANLRKTLTENISLNRQLCLDPKTHPELFDVRNFIRCLEDIAETEQKKMKAPDSPGSASPVPAKGCSPPKSVESKSPKAEAINFAAKNRRR